jgi:DnaD/phage-associated family protein
MDYQIDFANYKTNFSLPSAIMEGDLKNLNSDYLKVILLIFRNPDKDYSVGLLSNLLALSEQTVKDALSYWKKRGLLLPGNPKEKPVQVISERKQMSVPARPVQDSELQFLLSRMETTLQRPVTSTDVKTITYIYEYYRLPADVILMAVQYAAERGKNGIKYIESVCIGWYDQGITNHSLAEAFLQQAAKRAGNENQVKKLLGISGRKLIASEEKYINTWFNEFQFTLDVIEEAYERTVQNTGKVAFAYMNKILQNWYQKGYRTLSDILKNEPSRKGGGKPSSQTENSYDIDAFEKHLDKIPTLD